MYTDQVKNYTVSYSNLREFKNLVREIFLRNTYYVDLDSNDVASESLSPIIYDIGAHIGLTTLYYKSVFPQSQIIAVEPHPDNIQLFHRNMEQNRVTQVHLIEGAVSDSTGEKTLYADSSDDMWLSTSRLHKDAWDGTVQQKEYKVPCVTLDVLISSNCDLVKMDIEGEEEAVLVGSTQVFKHVNRWLIEYHPIESNKLGVLVDLLEQNNYKVEVYKNGFSLSPKKAKGLVLIDARKR